MIEDILNFVFLFFFLLTFFFILFSSIKLSYIFKILSKIKNNVDETKEEFHKMKMEIKNNVRKKPGRKSKKKKIVETKDDICDH